MENIFSLNENSCHFVKLVNSKKFNYILGIKDYGHSQGIMFDWLCLACFSGRAKINTHANAEEFFSKNSMIKNNKSLPQCMKASNID